MCINKMGSLYVTIILILIVKIHPGVTEDVNCKRFKETLHKSIKKDFNCVERGKSKELVLPKMYFELFKFSD